MMAVTRNRLSNLVDSNGIEGCIEMLRHQCYNDSNDIKISVVTMEPERGTEEVDWRTATPRYVICTVSLLDK